MPKVAAVRARPSWAQSLRALMTDPVGRGVLAAVSEEVLATLASHIAEQDPYGERSGLEVALSRLGCVGEVTILKALRHQLWCTHRDAAWRTGRLRREDTERFIHVEGVDWLNETRGHATVLISPMTLGFGDASCIVTHAIQTLAPDRSVVLYGEDIDAGSVGFTEIDERMAGGGRAAVRRILGSLAAGGIFCTYPDFVYQGHKAQMVQLFGSPRPISSAFVSAAARPGTLLLPCLLSHGTGPSLLCRFFEPLQVEPVILKGSAEDAAERIWHRRLVAQLVATTLEMLIGHAPSQWLLLTTLSFETPQMEQSAGVMRAE